MSKITRFYPPELHEYKHTISFHTSARRHKSKVSGWVGRQGTQLQVVELPQAGPHLLELLRANICLVTTSHCAALRCNAFLGPDANSCHSIVALISSQIAHLFLPPPKKHKILLWPYFVIFTGFLTIQLSFSTGKLVWT